MTDLGILKASGGHDFLYDFSSTLQQMMGDLDFSASRRGVDESACDENTFCTPDTIDQCISYLNQELLSLGLQGLSYDNQSKMTSLVNRLYEILRLYQKHGRTKEELENRLHRISSECEHYQNTIARLKTEREKLERDICHEQEKCRQVIVKHKTTAAKLKSEKEEVKRLLSVIKDRDTQFRHDLKKKERESNKLKERIHQLLADKTPNRRVGLDIAYSLQSSDGRRSTWKTATKNKQEEMYQHLVSTYEDKQRELMVENTELRDSLIHVHKEIARALGIQELSTQASKSISVDSDSDSSDGEQPRQSWTITKSHEIITEGYFQMPFDLIRENLENIIKERCRKLKEKKKRKLPSPSKNTKSSPTKPSPNSSRASELVRLQKQIDKYKDVIQQQEDLLRHSIQSQTRAAVDNSFLNDSQLLQERESFSEQKRLFYQEKANFEEERRQFTEAAIKLGKERKALEDEKANILKNQFLQISPFNSSSNKSTPCKVENIRLLPSTPVFSPAPSGHPKTPSTVELFRLLGISPKEQFLQRKNTSSDELKKSHSSESLLNSASKSDNMDIQITASSSREEMLSARKTLFHRRSSTGSNEDLGV